MDHPTDALPPGEAELRALQALRIQRQQERRAAEAEVFDLLRERCPGLDVGREIANGVEHYSAKALTDDAHPWVRGQAHPRRSHQCSATPGDGNVNEDPRSLIERNRELIAERPGWPAGAIEACRSIEARCPAIRPGGARAT